jgi:hypothetical protein
MNQSTITQETNLQVSGLKIGQGIDQNEYL